MKKSKILATILALCLIVASMPIAHTVFSANLEAATSFAGGEGTEENPYQISNAAELNYFSEYVNSQEATNSRVCDEEYFLLTNDIYLNEETEYSTWSDTVAPSANAQKWTAAGKASAGFAGEFNGDGYTIYGLYCESATAKQTGLFGEVRGTAVIKNVILSNAYLNATADGAGGFIGYAVPTAIGTPLTISNCGFSGIIKSLNKKAGGLVGYVTSTTAGAKFLMENSWTEGSLSANTNCGGLVGEFAGQTKTAAEITNCYSAMNISQSGTSAIGGLVGRILGGSSSKTTATTLNISNCHFAGNISANTPIVGKPSYFSGSMTLDNVYFKANSYSGTAAYVSTDSSVKLTATNVAEKTEDEFSDGTVTALLNGDTNDIWSQGEKYPAFKKEEVVVDLTDLTLSVGDLVFDNNTDTYNITVKNDVTEVIVTPTANIGNVIEVNGVIVESGAQSEAIALDIGLNTITVIVSDGMLNTKTYTINIVKNIKNDLNADYVFDINDVLVLQQILLDIPVENVIAENIDVNGDSFEDVCDLVALDNELL